MRQSLSAPYAALGLTIVFWAGSFPATRIALTGLSPEALMCARFTIASFVLIAWARWRGVTLPRQADFWRFVAVGSLAGFLYQMAFNYGMRSVQSGPAAALINTSPIFTAVLGAIFLRERVRFAGALGVLAGFAGATMIAFGETKFAATGSFADSFFRFEALLLLGAAVLFAVTAVMQKPLLAHYRVSAIAVCVSIGSVLPMFVFMPRVMAELPAAAPQALWALAYLALFPAAAAALLWNYALARLPAVQVSSSLYALAPTSFIIAWIFLGEVPAALSLAGALLAIGGVVLVQAPLLLQRRQPARVP